MKILLIVNASASSVTARARVIIQKALSADHDVTLGETSRRGHATRLAQAAAQNGTDVVVVLGGDGTLNEAANGLAGSSTALAPLPGGSTNVFSRTLGLPDDPIEGTALLLDALQKNCIRKVGLGSANGRYFLFHVGVGYDAAVVEQVERRGQLKRYMAHPLFIYSAFSTWFKHYDHHRPRFRVSFPDPAPQNQSRQSEKNQLPKEISDGYYSIIFNTNPYTYLGTRPLSVAPEATLDRGLVAVTIRSLGFMTIIGLAAASLRGAKHFQSHPKIDYRTDQNEIFITGNGLFPYQLDGDFLGYVDKLHFRHHPDVMSLVVPETPEASHMFGDFSNTK